jgi:hypothetical protein
MRQVLSNAVVLSAVVTALLVGSAHAGMSPPDTSWCSNPPLYQPFLTWGDTNWWALPPGENLDHFAGTGWTLERGATIGTRTLADGSTGQVLEMPSGSTAVSPPMCVGNGYPFAKTLILAKSKGSVAFTPYDLTTGRQMGTMQLLGLPDWSLTPPVNVLPGAVQGWHIMQFTFLAGNGNDDFEIYNFAIDPRMK